MSKILGSLKRFTDLTINSKISENSIAQCFITTAKPRCAILLIPFGVAAKIDWAEAATKGVL